MSGAHDVAEAVGLDDVAELGVDHQPADDQARVELEVIDRPPVGDEQLLEPVVDPLLPDIGAVVDQGVVHVVADGPDRPQVEGAVRVDLPPWGHLFETQCRFHHRGECSSRRFDPAFVPRPTGRRQIRAPRLCGASERSGSGTSMRDRSRIRRSDEIWSGRGLLEPPGADSGPAIMGRPRKKASPRTGLKRRRLSGASNTNIGPEPIPDREHGHKSPSCV